MYRKIVPSIATATFCLALAALTLTGCVLDDLTIIADNGTLWIDTHHHHDDGWDWWGFDGWWD